MDSFTKNLKKLGKEFDILKTNSKRSSVTPSIKVESAQDKSKRLKLLAKWYEKHENRPKNINKRNFETEDYTIIEKIKKDLKNLRYTPDGDVIVRKAYNDAIKSVQPLLKPSLNQTPHEVKQQTTKMIPYLYTIFSIINLTNKRALISNFEEKYDVIKGNQYNVQPRARDDFNIATKRGPRKIYKNNNIKINYYNTDNDCEIYLDEKNKIVRDMFDSCPVNVLTRLPCEDIRAYGEYVFGKCNAS